ncbi:MAG TPA: hypothetical protein VIM37_00015 [Candidatus Microsaccharimonas sp.]
MAVKPSDYNEAFETYLRIRRRTSAKQRLEKLSQQCVSYKANLADISEQQAGRRPLKHEPSKLKTMMTNLRAKQTLVLQEIQAIQSSLESYTSIKLETVRKEFAQLCANPHLLRIYTTSERTLELVIAARYTLEGVTYDLGDWSVEIGHKNLGQDLEAGNNVNEIRSGVLPTWTDLAPVYRIRRQTFCLGDNLDIVESYLRQRDYIAALEVITFTLCNINESDLWRLPDAFRKVA